MTYKTRQVEGEGGLGKQKGGAKAARVQDPAVGRGGSGRHVDRAGVEHHALQRTELPVAKLDLPQGPCPARPALGASCGARGDGRWHSPENRRQRLGGLRPRVAPLLAGLAGRPASGDHAGQDLPGESPLACKENPPSSYGSLWRRQKHCTRTWSASSKAENKTHASNTPTGSWAGAYSPQRTVEVSQDVWQTWRAKRTASKNTRQRVKRCSVPCSTAWSAAKTGIREKVGIRLQAS